MWSKKVENFQICNFYRLNYCQSIVKKPIEETFSMLVCFHYEVVFIFPLTGTFCPSSSGNRCVNILFRSHARSHFLLQRNSCLFLYIILPMQEGTQYRNADQIAFSTLLQTYVRELQSVTGTLVIIFSFGGDQAFP